MNLRGSELVVRALEDAGARLAFGIPGTHNIELYDALQQSAQVTAVLVTDEQSAGFMADGVSRSSDSVGVVNVVPGAGVTHCLSGVAEALLDGIPMVVLACGIRRDTGRAYQLHDIDQAALLRPVTKAVLRPEHAADIYTTVRRAFDLARAGTPGPVAVEIPAEFYLLTHDVADPSPGQYDGDRADATAQPGDLERAARLLNGAKRVLLYVGNGARDAGHVLVELAEKLGAPVATTIQGKGVFPEQHPLWLWNGLGATVPSPLAHGGRPVRRDAGHRLPFREVGTGSYGFTPPPTVVHVDINPEVFNRNVPATLAVEADAAAFLHALLPLVDDRGQWGEARRADRERPPRSCTRRGQRDASDARVTPAALFAALQRLAPDAIYTTRQRQRHVPRDGAPATRPPRPVPGAGRLLVHGLRGARRDWRGAREPRPRRRRLRRRRRVPDDRARAGHGGVVRRRRRSCACSATANSRRLPSSSARRWPTPSTARWRRTMCRRSRRRPAPRTCRARATRISRGAHGGLRHGARRPAGHRRCRHRLLAEDLFHQGRRDDQLLAAAVERAPADARPRRLAAPERRLQGLGAARRARRLGTRQSGR